ncbi:coagulation factor V isoform X1 [Mobula hypostoma]|uniref:coagulation factor V isoform X1 n=1 Tax=Mobula hypostoma TaxID=723540 RepID=UPI002FC30860
MKRCSSLLLLISCVIHGGLAAVRLYHVAAVDIKWVYSRKGTESSLAETKSFLKAVYKEYHDSDFTREKVGPEWRGLLGPTLRAEVGDVLKVHFKNKASCPFNIRPQGISNVKSADEFIHGNRILFESYEERIMPLQEHTYEWNITEEVGPTSSDPQCLTYTYSSDVNAVKDKHAGLIGALLICRPGSLNGTGWQNEFNEEFVLLFSVFDESESLYNEENTPIKMYSINGFTNGTLPELSANIHGRISWHLIGMSYDPEIFSVHFNGQVLLQNNHKVSSISLTSGSSITAEMFPTKAGKWLFSSQVQHHRRAELYGYLNLKYVDISKPSNVYHSRRLTGKIREYFIAAEEVNWNYASDIPKYIDSDFNSKYLEQAANRIGKIYKKAIYVEYTDKSFTQRKKSEEDNAPSILQDGIGVPIIRGEVKDVIKVYFKNKASRPYSIYPHGLTISKENEGVKYPGNSSDSNKQVEPGQTFVYTWAISEGDGPTSVDARCLTRVYHSAVDITRDIASGLFGPLLICKGQSLDARNLQIRVDEEQRIIFAAFDENQSWYIDENINLCLDPSSVDRNDPEFYESNIMYTINGFVYESKEALPFCKGDVIYWHVFSIGSQDRILSINFHGHTFKHRNINEDVIHLFPLSGETLTMQMDNSGEWLLRPLNTQPRTYGMRMRIKVYHCDDEAVAYPLHIYKIEYEGDKVLVDVSEEMGDEEIDDQTLEILKELGLRSFRTRQEMTEEEDILQYIEEDSAKHDTLNVSSVDSNGNQSKTSIPENNLVNVSNQSKTDDLDDYLHEADRFEELVKLNEISTEETLNEMAQVTATSISDSYPLNFTLASTHLSHNMQGIGKEGTRLGIFAKDYNARNDSSVLEDVALRIDANHAIFPINMNKTDIPVNLMVKSKRDLADTSVLTLKQSNIFQRTSDSASYVNITNGKGEKEYVLVTDESSSEVNNKGEDFIKQGNEESEGIHADRDTGGKQETEIEKGYAVKIHEDLVLGLINESLSVGNNQAIEPEHSPDFIQHFENKTIILNGSTIEATTNSEEEENNLSSKAPEYFTSAMKESSMESSEDPEKVFIFLKKHLKSEHKVRFKGVPLKPKGHHLTYQVEDKGVSVSRVKSLRKYIKHTKKNSSKKQLKNTETARQQVVAKMLKQRRDLKQISPRGIKPGIKQRTNLLGEKHPSSSKLNSKFKDTLIYQDDTSHSIIVGIPKRNNGVSFDYDEYIGNAEVRTGRAALEKDEEETELDAVNPYTQDSRTHSDMSRDPEMIIAQYLRSNSGNVRRYFIAAEEVYWDYSTNVIRNFGRSIKQRNTRYKKVIFRRYTDAFFKKRYDHGERDDHLGILGPIIRAEVNDVIKVMFKNLASRPYSIHAHGVIYDKSSEGMSYEDFSTDWYKSDDVVLPNTTYTYVWNVPPQSGPTATGSVCKPWVYYSGVDYEKDINSGLIGPLLICQNGTLTSINESPKDAREFILLFNTFDETRSWYFNDDKARSSDADFEMSDNSDLIQQNKFHAINGLLDDSLSSLVMFEKELVRFHLINIGTSEDAHSIQLDGHTFIERREEAHRLGTCSLYPGAFKVVELYSSKPGLWLLSSENGEHYKGGMHAPVLVLSEGCDAPLGMATGSITDAQITASEYEDDWEPKLARLHNQNRINAWSVEMHGSAWIQVDLERPMVLTEIATQGARIFFTAYFITAFYIEYSVDGINWKYYNGNSRSNKQIFSGNSDNSEIKFNKFDPPIIARYIKLYPTSFKRRPTLRMELYGCEIDYCSQPLGMKKEIISDDQITASSFQSSWWGSWPPQLARLDLSGRINAWKSDELNENQWLQVNLRKKMKITGIITQGAKSFTTTMFVQSYAVHFSFDGKIWIPYTDQSSRNEKIFVGNTDGYGHRKNYISPPILATYIRIIPKSWYNSIALRVEFIGCAIK